MLKDKVFTMDVERKPRNALEFSEILRKNNLEGEFYITGKIVEENPETCREIGGAHILGGHGYNHENFARLNYKEGKEIIQKTVDVFENNNLDIEGWRFPGFNFRNIHMRVLPKFGLFDSSIKRIGMKRWGKFIFMRKFFGNIKRGVLTFPHMYPENLEERTWDVVDLNNENFLKINGRIVTHCYNFINFKNDLIDVINDGSNVEENTSKNTA